MLRDSFCAQHPILPACAQSPLVSLWDQARCPCSPFSCQPQQPTSGIAPPTHPQPYTSQSLFFLMYLPLSRMVRGSRGPLQPPFAICLGCWDSAQQSRGEGGRGGGAGRVSSKAAELSCWLSCLRQLPCPPRLLASPPQGCQDSGHFWTEEFGSQLSVVWCQPPSPREAGCWAQGRDSAPPPSTCRQALCSLRASEQMREHCPLESLLRHFASGAGGNVREHVARAGRIPGSRRGLGGAGCGYFPSGKTGNGLLIFSLFFPSDALSCQAAQSPPQPPSP